MKYTFCPPQTPAQKLRDELLGALVALARATANEPKTEDTDQVLGAGLRLVSRPDAGEAALQKMLDIARTEKHRVAPNCATCAMPCGNTNEYDLQRLWTAPETIRTLKLRLLSAVCELAISARTLPCKKASTTGFLSWRRIGTPTGCGLRWSGQKSFVQSNALPETAQGSRSGFLKKEKLATGNLRDL